MYSFMNSPEAGGGGVAEMKKNQILLSRILRRLEVLVSNGLSF